MNVLIISYHRGDCKNQRVTVKIQLLKWLIHATLQGILIYSFQSVENKFLSSIYIKKPLSLITTLDFRVAKRLV